MSYLFKPTLLLDTLCAELNLSDAYAELTRQGYDMASFIGMDEDVVKEIFLWGITEDLQSFADDLDVDRWHPNVVIRWDAAKTMGFIN